MKNVPIFILIVAVTGFIIWESVNTHKVFNYLTKESDAIYTQLETGEIDDALEVKVDKLNDYWTREMDKLAISISKKDLQPVSDYLQYLVSAVENNSADDALTYARLLDYNIDGLKEASGITWLNLL